VFIVKSTAQIIKSPALEPKRSMLELCGAGSLTTIADTLRRRGFLTLRLGDVVERDALETAAAVGNALLGPAGEVDRRRCGSFKVPARHPLHPELVLHGLGPVSTPLYGGRRQFHCISGAADFCPWPSMEFRVAFEHGEAVLRARCIALLELLSAGAAEEWRSQVEAGGDPSVCDAFLYPAVEQDDQVEDVEEEEREEKLRSQAEEGDPVLAMGCHFDPGWWTAKQGCDARGLQLWDRERHAWVDAEDPSFYGDGCAPRDAIIMFAGERTQMWTQGTDFEVPAVPHRVVAPRGSRARVSFVFELRDHEC